MTTNPTSPSNPERRPLAEVQPIAQAVLHLLAPACAEIAIAGSVRRGKATVKDIEIVARPHLEVAEEVNLFGEVVGERQFNLLNEVLDDLVGEGVITKDTTTPRWGEDYRRFLFQGMVVEVFQADEHNWGYILALRTGPGDYNQLIMTRVQQRAGVAHFEGHLYKLPGGYRALPKGMDRPTARTFVTQRCTLLPVLTEADYYRVLGLPDIPPEERSVETLRKVLGEQR